MAELLCSGGLVLRLRRQPWRHAGVDSVSSFSAEPKVLKIEPMISVFYRNLSQLLVLQCHVDERRAKQAQSVL